MVMFSLLFTAPQKPDNVLIKDIETTSFKVTWDIPDPRPGKTNYTIDLTAESPADSKQITVSGGPFKILKIMCYV